MTKPVTASPSGFDYGYRPTSYFDHLDPDTLVVASILGEERRKDVKKRLASGDFDPSVWGEWITESKLDNSTRRLIGRAHPQFMGGEYLPQLDDDEIEIARVVCASVMQDVTSVRAKRRRGRISYRVVDEYDGKFNVSKSWSATPLTFGEMVALIDHSNQIGDTMANGLVLSILDWNLNSDNDFESMRGFVTVSSCYYPELARYYDQATSRYLDKKEASIINTTVDAEVE